MADAPGAPPPTVRITVSQLNTYVATLLTRDARLHNLQVTGEVSGLKRHSGGHWYFSLKDQSAVVRCVMFRESAQAVEFDLAEGQKILACGYATLHKQAGAFQFYVQRMLPQGQGELYAAFERRKRDLLARGWLSAQRKRPLPAFAHTIGVVTSPTGSVLQDIIQVAARRNAATRIVVAPTRVQGDQAAPEIARAFQKLQALPEVEVILLARGGGSIEDLWCFNEPETLRAVYECRVPVISAVGHETDTTLCDLVADVRAATPSVAAELAVPHAAAWRQRLQNATVSAAQGMHHAIEARFVALRAAKGSLRAASPLLRISRDMGRLRVAKAGCDAGMRARLTDSQHRLLQVHAQLVARSPLRRIQLAQTRLCAARRDLHAGMQTALQGSHQRLKRMHDTLDALNPLRVLQRGYTLTTDEQGKLVTHASKLAPGQTLCIRYADGSVTAGVQSVQMRDAPAHEGADRSGGTVAKKS